MKRLPWRHCNVVISVGGNVCEGISDGVVKVCMCTFACKLGCCQHLGDQYIVERGELSNKGRLHCDHFKAKMHEGAVRERDVAAVCSLFAKV